MAFILQDAFTLRGLFKGKGITRIDTESFLTDAFSKKKAGQYWKKKGLDAITQAGEEGQQGAMDAESVYDFNEAMGLEQEIRPRNFIERYLDFWTDSENLLEVAMGGLGGPIQYAITSLPSDIYHRKALSEQRKHKDEVIADIEEYALNTLKKESTYVNTLKKLMETDTAEMVESHRTQKFDELAIKAFNSGNAHTFEENLRNAKEETPENAEDVDRFLERLVKLEKIYVDTFNKLPSNDARLFAEIVTNLEAQKDNLTTVLNQTNAHLENITGTNPYTQKLDEINQFKAKETETFDALENAKKNLEERLATVSAQIATVKDRKNDNLKQHEQILNNFRNEEIPTKIAVVKQELNKDLQTVEEKIAINKQKADTLQKIDSVAKEKPNYKSKKRELAQEQKDLIIQKARIESNIKAFNRDVEQKYEVAQNNSYRIEQNKILDAVENKLNKFVPKQIRETIKQAEQQNKVENNKQAGKLKSDRVNVLNELKTAKAKLGEFNQKQNSRKKHLEQLEAVKESI